MSPLASTCPCLYISSIYLKNHLVIEVKSKIYIALKIMQLYYVLCARQKKINNKGRKSENYNKPLNINEVKYD